MEKGKAKQLLDKMQVLIEDGQNVPFAAGKVLVNKEEMLEMIEANKEAEDIIVDAEEAASRIRMSKPNPLYVQRQVKDLNKKDKMALRTANEIYAASIIYTNEMLMEINESVRQAYNMISEETDRVLDSLRQKSDVIEQNKRELMDGLLDMKKQERYADILEISQLLANELYYEKNRFEEEEQKTKKQAEENEMVQWEFDFEDKKEDPIKVKPSRQPVKLHDDILHDEVVDSAFEIADEENSGVADWWKHP